MNRNIMYEYLLSMGMYKIFRWKDDRKSYHTEFRLNEGQIDCKILTDWGYIRHVESIHLCKNELVIESRFSDMKVNMFYRNIEKFEVEIEYED